MNLESTAFREGGLIPVKHTCDGKNSSPHLRWSLVPAGTQSLALIVDDPEAPSGTFVHWVVYHIQPSVTELLEGAGPVEVLPNGAMQGRNGFGKIGYGGPCPPSGTHRYFFRLYALNAQVELHAEASRRDLDAAMKGKIIGHAELMGRYARQKH